MKFKSFLNCEARNVTQIISWRMSDTQPTPSDRAPGEAQAAVTAERNVTTIFFFLLCLKIWGALACAFDG